MFQKRKHYASTNKSDIIKIPCSNENINKDTDIYFKKLNSSKTEYILNHNLFDPTKNSPPNDFIIKLRMRIANYDSLSNFDN